MSNTSRTFPPHVMTIAGSDSGGGAGIQGDLKTIAAQHCYGSSVITALTAQNTQQVSGVHSVPPEFVVQQLETVVSDIPPVAIKTGMLASTEIIQAVVHALRSLYPEPSARPFIVIDPVMISTSGHTLLPDSAVEALITDLLPLTSVITPNIPEAKLLYSRQVGKDVEINSLVDMIATAKGLLAAGNGGAVLLKGGHLPVSRKEIQTYLGSPTIEEKSAIFAEGDEAEEGIEVLSGYRALLEARKRDGNDGVNSQGRRQDKWVVDVLAERQAVTLFVGEMVQSSSTHGTGCTLSAALACQLALGLSLKDACQKSIAYVQAAIATAFPVGRGHGPLNHAHLSVDRAIPLPTASNPHPFVSHLIRTNFTVWKEYVRHPFVVALGNGTLPRECFEHYLKQDYHYLVHYARAHGLGAYKSADFNEIATFAQIALHIARESTMHVEYCESFGLSLEDIKNTPESPAASAYARYILDIGAQGDVLDLLVAVLACLVGYGEVGLWLQRKVGNGVILEGNLYKRWIEDYSGKEYIDAVNLGIGNLEKRIADDPPSPAKLARLTTIWKEVVRLEKGFWDMGLQLA